MTIEITRKKLILTAGIVVLIAIVAAGITFMPEKSAPVPVAKALRQRKNANPDVPANSPERKATPRAGQGKTKSADTVEPDVIRDDETPEKTAQREDAYINDTPEKAAVRASLEKEIKALSVEKDKEVKEMTVMMKSFDDALNNSQLPPDELRTKQAEIEGLKQTLISAYNEKISSIDSSLKNKVQKYRDVTTENTESEVER
jgi:hypothetical protein